MNSYTIKAARMVIITRGMRVTFTEGRRIKFGKVTDVLHDHYRVACADGCLRRILKERVEPLTAPAGTE